MGEGGKCWREVRNATEEGGEEREGERGEGRVNVIVEVGC